MGNSPQLRIIDDLTNPATTLTLSLATRLGTWHFALSTAKLYPNIFGVGIRARIRTTVNQLYLPVNRPIIVKLKSKEVIHSFGAPEFRVKQDAVPGLTIRSGSSRTSRPRRCGRG